MTNKIAFIADILTILFFAIGISYAIYEMIQEHRTPEVVFQGQRAIGRTDKNGRPVYEGDVIFFKCVFPEEELSEKMMIIWDDEVCGFLCQDVDNGRLKRDIPSQEDFEKHIEVIANRWDPIETWGTER